MLFLQFDEYVAASPCVDGGVFFLLRCEYGGFPIGKTLCFRDFFAEDDGVHFLQTFFGDAELSGQVL